MSEISYIELITKALLFSSDLFHRALPTTVPLPADDTREAVSSSSIFSPIDIYKLYNE